MCAKYNVVVWGATGFTGRLVCEHIVSDYRNIRWAMAGRSRDKLEKLRRELCERFSSKEEQPTIDILVGRLDDPDSLNEITDSTDVIVSTTGPFTKYGMPLIESVIHAKKCNYVDITGEIAFVSDVIKRYHDTAVEKGIRIIPCCGYDSVPSDLGAMLVIEEMKRRHGGSLPSGHIDLMNCVVGGSGGVSGGTISSAFSALEDPKSKEKSRSQYCLIPECGEPAGKYTDNWKTRYNQTLDAWLAPFVMQVVNSRVVQRSNYLLNWGYQDLEYSECVSTSGWMGAAVVQMSTIAIGALMSMRFLHPLLKRMLPKPGEGPSRDSMMSGSFKSRFIGKGHGDVVTATVADPSRDPGYWSTSRMVLEAALCIALQENELNADPNLFKAGVLTPASGLGHVLLSRLEQAGYTLKLDNPST